MNNDLISREALKDFINEVCFSKEWANFRVDNGLKGQIERILTYIDNAPTVTKDNRPNICFNCEHCCALTVNSDGEVKVMCNLGAENCDNQRPHGEWIKDGDIPIECCKCSNCNAYAEWLDGGSQFLSKYCPNCGAKMDGGEE